MDMNCTDVRQRLDPAPAAPLLPAADDTARSHLLACELCRQWYAEQRVRAALARDPEAALDERRVDAILNRAVALGESRRRARWAVAGALAAGCAAVVLAALLLFEASRTDGPVDMPAFRVALVPHELEYVDVVIDSPGARPAVRLTVRLADGLELDGFAGEHTVSWQADLQDGRNLLRLPVRLTGNGPAELQVAMEGGAARRAVRVLVSARDAEAAVERG